MENLDLLYCLSVSAVSNIKWSNKGVIGVPERKLGGQREVKEMYPKFSKFSEYKIYSLPGNSKNPS